MPRFFDSENAAAMTMGERRALNMACEMMLEDDARWLALREEIMGDVLDAWSPNLRIADIVTRARATRRRTANNNRAFSELASEASEMLKRNATLNG